VWCSEKADEEAQKKKRKDKDQRLSFLGRQLDAKPPLFVRCRMKGGFLFFVSHADVHSAKL